MQTRAILESCIGKWKIGLCRNCENNLICFDQGWPQFVHRHALTIGDFIVFERTNTQHLHFNCYVFDSSACEKEFRAETKAKAKTKKKKANHESLNPTTVFAEDTPYFAKTMVPYNAAKIARVNIPTDFMMSNNLGKQTSAALRDPRGRAWVVKLAPANNGVRLRMNTGWHDFCASNGIKKGDICVFKLIRRKLTHATIFFDVDILPTISRSRKRAM